MDNFFKQNEVFLAIVVGALIGGTAVYFGLQEKSHGDGKKEPPPGDCQNIPELPDSSLRLATKVVDGDTFLIEGGYSVRILGVDADERGYPCYNAAKTGLEELILNKEVRLEKGMDDLDQYCRYLRYGFLPASTEATAGKGEQNIGLELVRDGLAIARFYEPDVKYKEEITLAEKTAIENKVGCKWADSKPSRPVVSRKFENLTAKKTGLEIVFACNAGNYYGKEVIIEGKVADGYRSKTNTVFFNFEKSYPNQCFTAVIFSSDQYKFVTAPEKYYDGKTVRIRGKIQEYQGKPEIILKDPTHQIEVGK